jgi:hypothetical protein
MFSVFFPSPRRGLKGGQVAILMPLAQDGDRKKGCFEQLHRSKHPFFRISPLPAAGEGVRGWGRGQAGADFGKALRSRCFFLTHPTWKCIIYPPVRSRRPRRLIEKEAPGYLPGPWLFARPLAGSLRSHLPPKSHGRFAEEIPGKVDQHGFRPLQPEPDDRPD